MEKTEEIYKLTENLWDVLKYWRKKRQLCFSRPFFELDLAGMQKSVAKVSQYLEAQLPKNAEMVDKSKPLIKKVKQEVKDTGIIVEYCKDLHKEVL